MRQGAQSRRSRVVLRCRMDKRSFASSDGWMDELKATDAELLERIALAISRGLGDDRSGGSTGASVGAGLPAMPPQDLPPVTRSAEGTPLARLAHELKTPLSAIAAAAEIMRDERLGPIGDPRYQGYAGDILESARHALGVIASMLGGMERAETQAAVAGRLNETSDAPVMTFTQFDPNDLIEKVGSSLRALLDAASLELIVALQPGMPHIVADAGAVRQMVLNLLSNAMRATPAGGRITLATSYRLQGAVAISVTDTGIGMDEAAIEGLLARGDAVDGGAAAAIASSRFKDGHGLGLPLVMRLAALNGARVAISSAPGQGTCVEIAFEPSRVVPA